MSNPPKILIVEDEAGIADTIQYVLESDGFTPVWCSTAEEALKQFQNEHPALAILDVGLPDMHGFELFRQLQKLPGGTQVPMLFLTARSDEIDRVAGLELGADDYIAKPFSPRELVARVRGILRRLEKNGQATSTSSTPQQNTTSATTATNAFANSRLPFELDEQRMQIRYCGEPLELSRYEYRLLRLLVQRPGRVFSREELLQLVWDEGNESFDRTVDAHIKTLRSKLRAVYPDVETIRTIRGIGYALNEQWPAA